MINPINDHLDDKELFCRVNIDAQMTRDEMVSVIARIAGGLSRRNEIIGDELDICIDDNDVFDAKKAENGDDRWLYFPYTLEIDPVEGIPADRYVAAVGALLQSLWSSGMDAVAACEFEESLPKNLRRAEWTIRSQFNRFNK